MADHERLEQSRTCVAIDEYAEPTGEGFAAVFEAFTDAIGYSDAVDSRRRFSEVGRHVGKAIICWDCAVDFDRDRVKGDFNPLTTATEVTASLDACLMNLATIGWALPDGSVSQDVIASVASRVRARKFAQHIPHPVLRLERWGLLRERGYSYAKCDGCEALCAVGECCECLGGAGEVAAAGSCCDCCFCASHSGSEHCGPPQKSNQEPTEAKSTAAPVPYGKYHGEQGVADSILNPSGNVRISEQIVPAKSHSGTMIGAGTPVTVVRTDAFGVSVVEHVKKENA